MIRTKHVFVAGVALVLFGAGGVVSFLTVSSFSLNDTIPTMPAAVVLGLPQDSYTVVSGDEAPTRDAFIDRVRDAYVPPPVVVEEPREEVPVEPLPMTPEPLPAPAPVFVPVAVIDAYLATTSASTSTVSATSSSFEGIPSPIVASTTNEAIE